MLRSKAGMSQAVGTRLFRKAGGMPSAMFRPSAKPLSDRYVSFAEREEFFECRAAPCGRLRAGSDEQLQPFRGSYGATPQPEAAAGVSRDDSAMACRSICTPPKAGEACGATTCPGTGALTAMRSRIPSTSGSSIQRSSGLSCERGIAGKLPSVVRDADMSNQLLGAHPNKVDVATRIQR
jgi:hypothetical protein